MDRIISDEQILTDSGFYWRERDGVKVLVCKPLEDAGFTNGFSTRLGGVSSLKSEPPASTGGRNAESSRFHVSSSKSAEDGFFSLESETRNSKPASPPADAGGSGSELSLAGFDEDTSVNIHENRRRFLSVFEGKYKLTSVWQVHGDRIKTVRNEADVENTKEKFDGAISNLPGILAGVKTADCVPVLIGDPLTRSYAAVHAGWRGTSMSIVSRAVKKMAEEFGSEPENLICAIGPAALCGNYEIGQEVIDAFAARFPAFERYFSTTREGHALVDLHLANEDQLTEMGVSRGNIYKAPFCTMERTDLFFSYRVEKRKYGRTGRLMSVIGLA